MNKLLMILLLGLSSGIACAAQPGEKSPPNLIKMADVIEECTLIDKGEKSVMRMPIMSKVTLQALAKEMGRPTAAVEKVAWRISKDEITSPDGQWIISRTTGKWEMKIKGKRQTAGTCKPVESMVKADELSDLAHVVYECFSKQKEALGETEVSDALFNQLMANCNPGQNGIPDQAAMDMLATMANFDSLTLGSAGKIVAVVPANASGTGQRDTITMTPYSEPAGNGMAWHVTTDCDYCREAIDLREFDPAVAPDIVPEN